MTDFSKRFRRHCLLCNVKDDHHFMKRCLELAAKGMGAVAPNPMVGAILVHEGKIVGEGFHRSFGGPHAEVHALAEVPDHSILRKCALYVNLEPCDHFGKTPPCSEQIIAAGVERVVVGHSDPNVLVAGKGISKLRGAGIHVQVGVLEKECRHLNRRFITFHEKSRPYVVLKWARSADGYMDINRAEADPTGVTWISSNGTQKLVHRWRTEEQAILIGATTLANDDPLLTARGYAGKDPHRVVLSHRGRLRVKARLFHDNLPIEVVSHQGGPYTPLLADNGTLKWTKAGEDENLIHAALRSLHTNGIGSVMVEGGAETLAGFIELGLWDEARVIVTNRSLGKGLAAPEIGLVPTSQHRYGEDLIITYHP